MRKIFLVLIAFFGLTVANSQVKDISFTFSPSAEYTWWDAKAGFNDGTLIGGKLGFGFGEYIELRGVYLQSLDLTTNFENFGLTNFDATLFTQQNAKLTRWGGEFKANIGTKKLMPYLTLGTGVQNIEVNATNFEQIYGTVGLGFKFNIAKRAVLSVEAKNTTYNFNAGSNLLSTVDKISFGVSDADFSTESLSNWAVLGSLQFYLGGRKPGTLSELDEAYLNKFKGGFKGLQLVVEPSIAHISFDEKSLLRDTYFLGGYVGLDFNEYIGLRGFYFKGTVNDEISTSFDNLAMYGVEFRARLNDGNGVTPYLILGGGYLNAADSYLGKNDLNVKSGEFGSGGLGLNIPLGRRVLISGGLRAILTSGDDISNISAPNQIQTHMMYNAGLKFTLGKKSKSPNEVFDTNIKSEEKSQSATNDLKIQKLKNEYSLKLAVLEEDLKKANQEKDVNKAIELLEEKNDLKTALKEINKVSEIQVEKNIENKTPQQETIIQMTPAEFESLIDRILKGLNENSDGNVQKSEVIESKAIDSLNKRIEMLEKIFSESKKTATQESEIKDINVTKDNKKENKEVKKSKSEDRLKNMDDEIELKSNEIKNKETDTLTIKKEIADLQSDDSSIEKNEKLLKYEWSNLFFGYDFSNSGYLNAGIRSHFKITKTNLIFMPEAFVGFGDTTYYGVSGNIIYSVNLKNQNVKPYFGAGVGALHNGNDFKGIYNAILGANLPVISDNLYIDYTMRNTFDYNQISIGYKLPI
ncbi:hypothetical protein [Lutibacter sp.]|uniref:hypothetical protein n=1 Tax=Lutibacter sp. TaxID=1925666 RepID=UPI001A20EEB0|nr:hypothetical protein [Lutibacter sp.]MBI9040503.1 hypothetical protein [Lutibacter sp.]